MGSWPQAHSHGREPQPRLSRAVTLNVFEPHKEKWELGKQVILAKCTVFA